jgi:threonylcarbamoyladenosine tRNA methylthiotransferase MtaB
LKTLKVALATLGCKLNQVDTEAIREAFERAGWQVVPFAGEADVYVINTCTVTGETDHQSRQLLRRALRRKEKTPGIRVIATGCYAQTAAAALAAAAPGIDLITGNIEKEKIPELLGRLSGGTEFRVRDISGERTFRAAPIGKFSGHTRAFLRVQEGCDRRCAYCIVPLARGRERSATLENAVEQACGFVANGYKEIVVTGIHIGRYGKGLGTPEGSPGCVVGEASLAKLILHLNEVEGLHRIRLSSLDPTEFPEQLYEALDAARGKLCDHFHIAIQSGADPVLRAMRRGYTAGDCREAVRRLRGIYPDACIGADIIVGFPGESDDDFNATYHLIEDLGLAYMHVFRYSSRPGTAAAEMAGRIPAHIKKERSRALLELRRGLNEAYRARFIGRELEVMFEARREKKSGLLTGLSRNYIRVFAADEDGFMGRIAFVVPDSLASAGVSAAIVRPAD